MHYIKIFSVLIWFIFCSILGLIYSIIRWGNDNIDRDFGRFFSWGTLKILGIKVEVDGLEHLEAHQPCIYIANHQSGLDMATFGKIYPSHTVVIGKKELIWIPFFGIFYVAAGNILINRQKSVKAVAGLRQAVEAIRKRKISIWIFPEGTRNRQGGSLLPFKRGAFHMASQAGVPIVPLVSSPLNEVANWKDRKASGGIVRIKVLPPIYPQDYEAKGIDQLMSDTYQVMLEALHSLY